MSRFSRWVLAAAMLSLVACSTAPQRPVAADAAALAAQAEREARLAELPEWTLSGKVAVRSGNDGGSGQLSWQEAPGRSELALRAPISGQGWRLVVSEGAALLEGLEEGPRHDSDAARLLREATGWQLPVESLRHWVRGARAAGSAQLSFAADGLPAQLRQAGWQVDYLDWYREFEPPLPRRLVASRGEHRVRLVVATWQ